MILTIAASFTLGLTRGGLKVIGVIAILLMTIVYGAKSAAGIIVPLLVVGDIFALVHYRPFIQNKLPLDNY